MSSQDKIEKVKANLPLPEQPPVASDWQSADARNVNVGSGGVSGDIAQGGADTLREPATAQSSARVDGDEWKTNTNLGAGRQGVDNLSGLPNDAVTKEARHSQATQETRK